MTCEEPVQIKKESRDLKNKYLWRFGGVLCASVLGGVLASVFLTGGVGATAQSEVLTASQLNLVDDDGRLRMVMAGSDDRGAASISMYDHTGQVRSTVGIRSDGTPLIELHGEDGDVSLRASVEADGARIVVGSQNSSQGLFGSVQGRPILTFSDGERSRLQLHLSEDGLPRLALSDESGIEAASMSVGSDEMPQLSISSAGQRRAVLTVAQDATVFNFSDGSRPRLVIGVAENGRPSVNFLDESGEIVFSAPR